VFILIYDEGDGHFDHVGPPVAPPGTADEFITSTWQPNLPSGTQTEQELFQGPIGPGFRVPCIIASPWTAGGHVCSVPFDHTSVLRFLGLVTGVAPLNISQYRMDIFGDLTDAFDFAHPVPLAAIPELVAPPYVPTVNAQPLAPPVLQRWPPTCCSPPSISHSSFGAWTWNGAQWVQEANGGPVSRYGPTVTGDPVGDHDDVKA
jgi:phospholipase C